MRDADDAVIVDMDSDVERLSVELLDELASNERRALDPKSLEVRVGNLKEMSKSPAHYLFAARYFRDDTLSQRLGSAVHAMTFGTHDVISCEHRRGTKARKAFDEKTVAETPNAMIVSPGEYRKAKAMSEAIRRNKVADRILFTANTIIEQTIHWEHRGRKCRSTPDSRHFRTVADLKTTRSADPFWFHRDALRMFYHVQLASYRHAIKYETKVFPHDAYVIAVENVAPYVVTPFRFTERALEAGWRLFGEWFERLLTCETTGLWPEYTLGIEELDVFDEQAEVAIAMRDDDGMRADPSF
jgi:hypothetical protein